MLLASIFSAVETSAARQAAAVPVVAQTRERAADIVARGYDLIDWWELHKPVVFISSALSTVFYVVMAYRRRATPEALVLWSAQAALSALVAYVSRPPGTEPQTQLPGSPAESTTLPHSILALLDSDAATKSAENPNWERETWQRLLASLGLDDNAALAALVGAQ